MFPEWLREVLECPECHKPCCMSPSGYMVCPRVPRHTGLHTTFLVNVSAVQAWKKAKATGRTRLTEESQVHILASIYLRRNTPEFIR